MVVVKLLEQEIVWLLPPGFVMRSEFLRLIPLTGILPGYLSGFFVCLVENFSFTVYIVIIVRCLLLGTVKIETVTYLGLEVLLAN
jgi:hypothetical protein